MNRKAVQKMILLHLILAVGVLAFPLYIRFGTVISKVLPGCLLHDFLFLYCPLCGGTRAVSALLRLDLPAALRYNAFAVLIAVVGAVFYVLAWIRLFRGKEKLFRVPQWMWTVGVVLMVAFGILRDLVMIVWGVDPLGDLAFVWNHV